MVASGHALATDAALDVLRAGGNAVDAAVCAALVLCVVCPYACTLGGDMFAVVYDPATMEVAGLNATGRSPRATPADVSADDLRLGILSATIPGVVRGLANLLERFGSRTFGALLQPAITLAQDGFAVHPTLAANTRERAEMLARDPGAGALFLPGGEPLAVGTLFTQPRLAAVLRTLAADGPGAFYAGDVPALIVADAQAAGGTFALDDFHAHASLWQSPVSVPFYGHDVWTMPPNSYGPTLMLQLAELESGRIDALDPGGVEFITRGFAARRRAYAQAAPTIADPGCTTNAIVIDGNGMAVSLIESISAPYGSGVVLERTGILLNNRMAGFNAGRAHPNGIGPAKRPANTLAPCMVTHEGRLVMSLGTPGTVGQTCTLAQFLARVFACGQELAPAVDAPRWSVDFAGKLVVEDGMDPAVRDAVIAATPDAHVMRTGWISFGSIKAATLTPAGLNGLNGLTGLTGIADYRRAATTAGW
ncbi:MAG: gamma-glutamyltransferase [Candidatus Lustribacter sp.]|jgi:gamma-glutamyltranspeptidase/glutathione hydrolase